MSEEAANKMPGGLKLWHLKDRTRKKHLGSAYVEAITGAADPACSASVGVVVMQEWKPPTGERGWRLGHWSHTMVARIRHIIGPCAASLWRTSCIRAVAGKRREWSADSQRHRGSQPMANSAMWPPTSRSNQWTCTRQGACGQQQVFKGQPEEMKQSHHKYQNIGYLPRTITTSLKIGTFGPSAEGLQKTPHLAKGVSASRCVLSVASHANRVGT